MVQVLSPVAGRRQEVSDVPDPVFARGLVGPGAAIAPRPGPQAALAPIDGTVAKLHPHAYVILSDRGPGVLVHLGIDTVQLNGEGFELLVNKGDRVTRGQGVVRWDPVAVEAAGKSPVCPVVALEATAESLSDLRGDGDVKAGDSLFVWK